MTESARTGIYVAAAALALGVAWLARPASSDNRKDFDDRGLPFFTQFDPLAAKSMEITGFNETTSRRNAFKVAQENGRWSIPSHEGYPADAKDHLAQAAASVMDLKKGPKISDLPADRELYGVADPAADKAGLGSGTRVTLQDEGGKTLVDLIIGKVVKDSPTLHYVRVPDKDRVYTAQVNTQHLSTKFEDWIERDLLKLNPANVKDVTVDDYSIDEINGKVIQGDRMTLHYALPTTPPAEGATPPSAWTLEGLGPDESLEPTKLEAMRTAMGDLRIIDVHKKPAAMSAALAETGTVKVDQQTQLSLQSRGYYFVQGEKGAISLLSNQGEITVHTTEGIAYNLRFGEIINVDSGTDLTSTTPDSAANEQSGRFLFVTASFDPKIIEAPKYDPVPGLPEPAATQGSQPASQPASQPFDPRREQIVQANDAKRQEYEKKIKEGQDKAKELNARFADWYYIVSDSVYQKLRFKRQDIVALDLPGTTQPQPAPAPATPPNDGG